MRSVGILLSVVLLMCMLVPAHSGHSTDNDTCDDDKTHYENMIVNGKRDDAPLIDQSKAMRDQAHKYKNYKLCEKYMEEALRMIRKTDGEYPTE
tara:strand:- start:11 stop:292 length:282 start_codon:yes stop_codon:yes gene_type:complete